MLPLKCPMRVISQTLDHLQNAGRLNKECIVLWLGHRREGYIEIAEVLRPVHIAKADMFHIPPASMREIMEYLRKNRLMIAAQVHSHPELAFHSRADDKWAIVRHVGAISIVLPYFGANTTPATFMQRVASFALTAENRWIQVKNEAVEVV